MKNNPADSNEDKLSLLSAAAQEAVRSILSAEEKVLWVGKPVPNAAWSDAMPGNIKSRRACAILYVIEDMQRDYQGWLRRKGRL